MQAYTEITPPTAVTHAITASLVTPKSINLIVAKTSLLQVFEVRTVSVSDAHADANGEIDKDHWPSFAPALSSSPGPHQKLVLVGEFPVAGSVTSLASVKVPGTRSGGDLLLVAFRDAKVSLVEWDPLINGITTVSIHYFEGEDDQGPPWMPRASNYSSYLTTDPRNLCAALVYGRRSLAILPFRQDSGDTGVTGVDDPDAMVEDDDETRLGRKVSKPGDTATEKRSVPVQSSYTLLTTMLDPDLVDPIDITFLYEYREPTLGVLSASSYPSDALIAERKDSLTFTTFTIDVEERACTQLLSIRGLPTSIFQLFPLSLPIGGTLLVGCNELIHIDQSGKTYAVAVNDFATQNTAFAMNDQSSLGMKLEESVVQRMSYNLTSLLIVLRSGDLATLSFKMEGRTMAGMFVKRIHAESGGRTLGGAASCAAMVGLNTMFIGSEQADASLLECHSSMPEMARKRSHAEMLGLEDDDLSDLDAMEDEDDLYGGDSAPKRQTNDAGIIDETPSDISFTVQDILPNHASLSEAAVARRYHSKESPVRAKEQLELVIPTGCGTSGSLDFLNRSVPLDAAGCIETNKIAKRVWSITTRAGSPKDALESLSGKTPASPSDTRLMIIDHRAGDAAGASSVRRLTEKGAEEVLGADFETDIETIFAGSLAGGTRVIQVSPTELRSYDQELNLSEIVPMADEETDTEFSIRHASFADPFLLLIRDDASAVILKVDEGGDLQEVEKGEQIQEISWSSGCLHRWAVTDAEATLYLLSEKGGLHMYALPDLSRPIYVAEDLRNLPAILTSGPASRRGAMQTSLAEILVADLGTDDFHSPFLFIRTENDDVEVYEPFTVGLTERAVLMPNQLRWIRRSCSFAGSIYQAGNDETNGPSDDSGSLHPCLTALEGVSGHYTVFIPSKTPSLVFKEASSTPKLLPLEQQDVHSLATWKSSTSSDGIALVDSDGSIALRTLFKHARFGDIGWASKRLHLGEEVEHVAYHALTDRFVIGINNRVNFSLPDDEAAHHAWVKEEILFKPSATHSTVRLLNPETWSIVGAYSMPNSAEHILCMTVGNFEISEHTHEKRMLIAVGTSLTRGEDLPALGCVYLFDVIRVAPDPAHPGTELALKLIVREEVRGAVTGLCEAGAQGLLMIAMGQKINVRGLTEAGTLLPAAFMDMQEHIMSLKNLKGTGMCLAADAFKGTWFVGFQAEPFKMNLFGKSRTELPIVAMDFLPYDTQLLIVLADAEGNIHMLEYNPESPSSLSGQRLLHRAAIHAGHDIVSTMLLPCSPPSFLSQQTGAANGDTHMTNGDSEHQPAIKDPMASHQLLVTHATGALSLIHPLSEASYRRLTALQSFLTSSLDAPCAMNPRSYRAVDPSLVSYKGAVQEGSSVGAAGGTRTVVDGALVARWRELGVRGRADAWGRVGGFLGGGEGEILAGAKDVEILNGAGLSFF